MNRSGTDKPPLNLSHNKELMRTTAVHEAGHAVGIYLGNQGKQLPPVHFQIVIKRTVKRPVADSYAFAKIQGGRLIHTLPSSFAEAVRVFSPAQRQAYQNAFEADIVNYLIGPLAEAHYVAVRDGELFHPHLLTVNALCNYGGGCDLDGVYEYLECLFAEPIEQEKKLAKLFLEAFHFVSERSHWFAINALANYILADTKDSIACEEAMTVIDAGVAVARKKPSVIK